MPIRRGRIIGSAAVLKTAARKGLQVRVLSPPPFLFNLMKMSIVNGLTFLFGVLLFAGGAAAQVQSFGEVSFAVPDGWEYSVDASGDHATLSTLQNGQVVALAVFRPLRSTGNPDNDFRAAWAKVARSMQPPEPIYEHKSLAGYQGRYGSTNTPDNSQYVYLCVLEAGESVLPVLVVTPDRQSFNSLEPIVSLFVEGVRRLPLKAQSPKTNITIADLVGEWHSSGDSSLNYVTSSGAYAGSSTVAHGVSYTIASNGSYKSQFAGIANRQIVRGNSIGTVELGSGTIGFRERGGRLSRYHFVSYQTALNGATVLTLLGDQYEANSANVSFYGEKWVREPKQ